MGDKWAFLADLQDDNDRVDEPVDPRRLSRLERSDLFDAELFDTSNEAQPEPVYTEAQAHEFRAKLAARAPKQVTWQLPEVRPVRSSGICRVGHNLEPQDPTQWAHQHGSVHMVETLLRPMMACGRKMRFLPLIAAARRQGRQ